MISNLMPMQLEHVPKPSRVTSAPSKSDVRVASERGCTPAVEPETEAARDGPIAGRND
jgi:hypothetical protein